MLAQGTGRKEGITILYQRVKSSCSTPMGDLLSQYLADIRPTGLDVSASAEAQPSHNETSTSDAVHNVRSKARWPVAASLYTFFLDNLSDRMPLLLVS
jgi:hypothetical protein